MNIFRYSIAELFLLMIYGAIIVWCFQDHWATGIFCLGTVLGIESGRKTKYSVLLMVPAGLVMAAAFVLAISMTFSFDAKVSVFNLTQKTQERTDGSPWGNILLDLLLIWGFPIATLLWFFRAWSTVKEAEQSREDCRIRREKLESLVKEKRETIKDDLAS